MKNSLGGGGMSKEVTTTIKVFGKSNRMPFYVSGNFYRQYYGL